MVTVWISTVGHITQDLHISKSVHDIWKDLTGLLMFPMKPKTFSCKLTKLTHADSSFPFIFINICSAVGLRRLYPGFWPWWPLNVLIPSAGAWLVYSFHGNISGLPTDRNCSYVLYSWMYKNYIYFEKSFFSLFDCCQKMLKKIHCGTPSLISFQTIFNVSQNISSQRWKENGILCQSFYSLPPGCWDKVLQVKSPKMYVLCQDFANES